MQDDETTGSADTALVAHARGRALAIDYGLVRVGLALSDELRITAQPLCTIDRRGDKHVCREIAAIVEDRRVMDVIVGLPLEMSGERGETATLVQRFVDRLGNYLRVPIHLWDERLTSVAAQRALSPSGRSKKRRAKRKAMIDQVAACLILQGYLASQSSALG